MCHQQKGMEQLLHLWQIKCISPFSRTERKMSHRPFWAIRCRLGPYTQSTDVHLEEWHFNRIDSFPASWGRNSKDLFSFTRFHRKITEPCEKSTTKCLQSPTASEQLCSLFLYHHHFLNRYSSPKLLDENSKPRLSQCLPLNNTYWSSGIYTLWVLKDWNRGKSQERKSIRLGWELGCEVQGGGTVKTGGHTNRYEVKPRQQW